MKRYFDIIPLMTIPVLLYSVIAAVLAGSKGVDIFVRDLEQPAFYIPLPSDASWGVSGGTLLVALGLVILFFELIRGVANSELAIIHHTMAVLIALATLGSFLIFPAFGTSTFFLISIMCILDMIGGIIVNIAEASSRGRGGN